MNRSIKLALLAVALVMVAIAYSAEPAPKAKAVDCATKEIEGIYHASSSGDDESASYSGSVMISKTPKEGVYLLVWASPNREESSMRLITAAALRNGASLSVTWKVNDQVGLMNYKIEPSGMIGKWILLPNGASGVKEERLRFLSPFDVPST